METAATFWTAAAGRRFSAVRLDGPQDTKRRVKPRQMILACPFVQAYKGVVITPLAYVVPSHVGREKDRGSPTEEGGRRATSVALAVLIMTSVKLTEKAANIALSGQNDLSING